MGLFEGGPSVVVPEQNFSSTGAWTADLALHPRLRTPSTLRHPNPEHRTLAAIFTPIRFVKTEVIDVDKSGQVLPAGEGQEPASFKDENLPVLSGYESSILSLPARPISQGLKNFGTTCFVNSVLQLLGNLSSFRDLVVGRLDYVGVQGFSLVNFLKQIFTLMFDVPGDGLLAPTSLVKNISYIHNSFVPYKQQDAMCPGRLSPSLLSLHSLSVFQDY